MKKQILALLFFLTSCGYQGGDQNMNPMVIKIKVGELGSHFLKDNNLPAKGHIDRQPAGLSFYEHDWNTKTPGTVILEHEAYSFQIPHALGVMGTEDNDRISAGLESFSIRAGITAADTIMHDEARLAVIALLENLIKLGWKPVFFYEEPRLRGDQAFKYLQNENKYYGMPLDYKPTLDEWMRIDSDWYLHAKDVFLEISLHRDSAKMNPNEPGAYLLSFRIQSKEEKAKAQFEGDDRDHWQELWVDKIKLLKKQRYEKEKELIKRGYTIFTDYEEPKIHAADPVEP